jgi:hypothetical protein
MNNSANTSSQPSITIWIDPATTNVSVQFNPQQLTPAEYGVVIATLLVHIARLFRESNPAHTEDQLLVEIYKGIDAGLAHRKDFVLPSKAH